MAVTTKPASPRRLRRWLALAGVAALVLWLLFLDSHSITRRALWHREVKALQAENAALRASIADLEQKLDEATSEAVVEQIAREQYGMRRPGETVYPVERDAD